MATSAPETSSAGKSADDKNPRNFLPLSHLDTLSARIGLWEVMVWDPKDSSHSYLWDGQKRQTYGFQCKLISVQDPRQYVLADSHGKGMTESIAKALEKTFKGHAVL